MGSSAGLPPTLTAPLGNSCTKAHAIARVAGLSATPSQRNTVVVRSSTRVVRAGGCRASAGKVRSIIGMVTPSLSDCLQSFHNSQVRAYAPCCKGGICPKIGKIPFEPEEGEDYRAQSR